MTTVPTCHLPNSTPCIHRVPFFKPSRTKNSNIMRTPHRRSSKPRLRTMAPPRALLLLLLLPILPFLQTNLPSISPPTPAPATARTPATTSSSATPHTPLSPAPTLAAHAHEKGVLMSCPPGQSHTHRGPWKPSRMTLGAEGVLRQLVRYNVTLPFYLAYYANEQRVVLPWCRRLATRYPVDIHCFRVPERYPKGLYGYAKIFAIRYVPVRYVLWLDCDVFPVRDVNNLFRDVEFVKSGAMFWPDSRDFFDESALPTLLPQRSLSTFPTTSWYVKQGFDTGILLLDRQRSKAQLEHLCQIALSPKLRHLRKLSMGDKDIFHVVWMLSNKNFTLVPYIGETGSIQASIRKGRRSRGRWVMSSQVKYDRSGRVVALHQLHRQLPNAIIADVGKRDAFSGRMTRSTTHVKPYLSARLDLRMPAVTRLLSGSFVPSVEGLLLGRLGKGIELTKGIRSGALSVERAPSWIHAAAAEMARVWKHGLDAETAARDLFRDHRKVLLMRRASGGYQKSIYRRLWKERKEWRRQFIREVEDRGIRRK